MPDHPRLASHVGMAVVLATLTFAGFGTWAATAPLTSAVIAGGVLAVESNRHAVANAEGGLVGEVLVREGERVAAGQVLMRLDDSAARASLGALEAQIRAQKARRMRLIAERDDLESVALDASSEPEGPEAVEQRAFVERRAAYRKDLELNRSREAELARQLAATRNLIVALDAQRALIGEEQGSVETLLDKALATRSRLLALKRASASLDGQEATQKGQVAALLEQIAQVKLQSEATHRKRIADAVTELADVDRQLAELGERVAAGRASFARRDVTATVSGTVLDLAFPTAGMVVAPGARILSIVPQEDRLVVEAQIRPADVDKLVPGLTTRIRFTSLPSRLTPEVTGVLERISPDVLTDPRTGAPYYAARVSVTEADLEPVRSQGKLVPGVPVEAHVTTGSRTLLAYLAQPLTDMLARAARER